MKSPLLWTAGAIDNIYGIDKQWSLYSGTGSLLVDKINGCQNQPGLLGRRHFCYITMAAISVYSRISNICFKFLDNYDDDNIKSYIESIENLIISSNMWPVQIDYVRWN